MPELLSNHLKAIMIPEDVTSVRIAVPREDFFTVQHFEYKCERSCDEQGSPEGPTLKVLLNTSIKMVSADAAKLFYERLKQNSRFPYSFIFNATFDSERRLDDFEDGMVVYGYVVDVGESHNCQTTDETERQVTVSFNVLVTSITYLGKEAGNNLTLNILCNSD